MLREVNDKTNEEVEFKTAYRVEATLPYSELDFEGRIVLNLIVASPETSHLSVIFVDRIQISLRMKK